MIQRLLTLLGVPFLALACASPPPREALLAADSVFTPAGAPPRSFQGKYFTVWQRADAGSWRLVADGGSGNAPPPDRR